MSDDEDTININVQIVKSATGDTWSLFFYDLNQNKKTVKCGYPSKDAALDGLRWILDYGCILS